MSKKLMVNLIWASFLKDLDVWIQTNLIPKAIKVNWLKSVLKDKSTLKNQGHI